MLEILYQDEWFVAVNKPSGMLIHRNAWCPREQACFELLRDQLDRSIYPVHRIDRATSGVVIFALDSDAAARLSDLFRAHLIRKAYLAVVRGFVEIRGALDDPLKRESGNDTREALTDFRREAIVELHAAVGRYSTARYSLVRALPRTGRHHQIRRHFAHASHPVIGDTKHGDSAHNRFFRDALGVDRLLLMATDLIFSHPFCGTTIRVHAPLPVEINRLFSHLGWPVDPETSMRDPLRLLSPESPR